MAEDIAPSTEGNTNKPSEQKVRDGRKNEGYEAQKKRWDNQNGRRNPKKQDGALDRD